MQVALQNSGNESAFEWRVGGRTLDRRSEALGQIRVGHVQPLLSFVIDMNLIIIYDHKYHTQLTLT